MPYGKGCLTVSEELVWYEAFLKLLCYDTHRSISIHFIAPHCTQQPTARFFFFETIGGLAGSAQKSAVGPFTTLPSSRP